MSQVFREMTDVTILPFAVLSTVGEEDVSVFHPGYLRY